MEFIGEHLLPGQLGHFSVVLSFVTALLSFYAFTRAAQSQRANDGAQPWFQLGRIAFGVHGIAVLGIIGSLFYILVHKYYEYQYAWSNVSDDLPFRYTFSAFWKEQQGSFLLWSFWHVILGAVFLRTRSKFEGPVMATVALAEVFIGSMLLGVWVGDSRFGVSPFDLLRDAMDAPIFAQADYISKISKTAQGLNPLLQNYWMTIHPPTLFLGFASTIIPFGFAIGGLWQRDHRSWLQPALHWALFSGAILGLGILMGGAWAYEALSFGGYWAWDPVENSSLVPWILMVGGIHTNLVARSTGYSIKSTYGLYLLSFLLVLYSTYLTRSGILGDTSAHAFTEMGLSLQLLMFIAFFSLWALAFYVFNAREISVPTEEERVNSREFWMFVGALVLFFSSVLITGATSLPVWNKIVRSFKPEYVGAALSDPISHHNRYQLWIAVFIGMLTGIAQFMRYGEKNWAVWGKKFGKHLLIAGVAAALLTAANARWIHLWTWQFYAMLFAGMFAITANLDFLVSYVRGNLKQGASAIAHIGFGILSLGILSSGLNKEWISSNTFAMDGLIEGIKGDESQKNVILMKEAPMPIKKEFQATYLRDTVERQTRTFSIDFRKLDSNGNPSAESFTLMPNVMYDRQFSKIVASNPSTQHYWNYDIFTHISSLPKAELDPAFAKSLDDSLKYQTCLMAPGDTFYTEKHGYILRNLTRAPKHRDYSIEPGDLAFGAEMSVFKRGESKEYPLAPAMFIRPGKGAFALYDGVSNLMIKSRLPAEALDKLLKEEDALKYQTLAFKDGNSLTYKGFTIHFAGVDRHPKPAGYLPEEGDLAVSALLEITAPDGRAGKAAPTYVIRGNQPFGFRDDVPDLGLNFRFEGIDPKTETISIGVAQTTREQRTIPIEIAENASRSDYIVLEAIIFPGINFVWLGSLLMIFGLALGLLFRLQRQQNVKEPV